MARGDRRRLARNVLAGIMVTMGILHFVAEPIFRQIIPPFLPWPTALVLVSGVCELSLGIGLLIPRTRRLASYGLVALFIAVFPANVYMAYANIQIEGLPSWAIQPSATQLWLRLPFQIVFILWAIYAGRGAETAPAVAPA